RLVRYLRDFLDALDFLEVETPMMQPIPGGASARPFRTHHNALDLDMYLRVAPELYLKRLIVGGLERVYEINRNFRNEGLSTQHNPEFTMLELYLAYADYRELMDWIEKAIQGLADALHGRQEIAYQGRSYDLSRPFARLTVEQAIIEHCPGIDPLSLRDLTYLRRRCEQLGVKVVPGDGVGKLQIELFEKTAESKLLDPTFVYAYPVEVSPLSRPNDTDPFIADRFEFFLAGREIANGFSELNDPEEQAARFRAQAARRCAGDVLRRRLRARALVRHAARRGSRRRHRPAGHVLHRLALDPRRHPVPAHAAGSRLSGEKRGVCEGCLLQQVHADVTVVAGQSGRMWLTGKRNQRRYLRTIVARMRNYRPQGLSVRGGFIASVDSIRQ